MSHEVKSDTGSFSFVVVTGGEKVDAFFCISSPFNCPVKEAQEVYFDLGKCILLYRSLKNKTEGTLESNGIILKVSFPPSGKAEVIFEFGDGTQVSFDEFQFPFILFLLDFKIEPFEE